MAAASRCPEQRAVLALRPVRSVLALDGRGVWGEAVTQALKVVFLEWVWHEQINHE